jgi:5-methyltetrahydropteroyltriglutamate--homocysteine methyltransferase
MHRFPKRSKMQNAPEARNDLHYLGTGAITEEIDRLQKTVKATSAFKESFMTAPSPGIISTTMLNAHYDSQESYLMALAREMANEYRAIVEAGLILQIDSPDLAMDRAMFYRDLSDAQFVKACRCMWLRSTKRLKEFRAIASGSTAAGEIGTARTFLTSRSG